MPLFDFYCPKCKKEEERLVNNTDVNHQYCECNSKKPMQKMDKLGINGLQFKGKWFKTSGEY